MRLISSLLLMLSLSSCQQDLSNVKLYKAGSFILVDTTAEANQLLPFGNSNCDYPIYYKGVQTDTIKIGRRYWIGRTNWNEDIKMPWSRTYSSKTLEIYVDTLVKTNSPIEFISDSKTGGKNSTANYHSLLVSIKNISDSSIYLGRTFSLFYLHREARNKHGNWVPVDNNLSEAGLCLTGEPTIVLNPGELILSKLIRFKGAYTTDFRLCFGYGKNLVYSNTFRDQIEESVVDRVSFVE